MTAPDDTDDAGTAEYVFRARLRPEPRDPDVSLNPEAFETVVRKRATTPGEEGWLFFRDALWRGAAGDEAHLRDLLEDAVGVPVESVTFSELRADPTYVEALREAIGEDLTPFRAGSVDEVLHKYLGSSVHVRPGDARR
jgi:hypothetical protein